MTEFTKRKACGECQACCWQYALPFLTKPAHSPCKHQCKEGCAIHDQKRHPVCETFLCEWRDCPDWPDEWRPDKCGVIYRRWTRLTGGKHGDVTLYCGDMMSPGTYQLGVVPTITYRLNKAGHIILYSHDPSQSWLVCTNDRKVDRSKIVNLVAAETARERETEYGLLV